MKPISLVRCLFVLAVLLLYSSGCSFRMREDTQTPETGVDLVHKEELTAYLQAPRLLKMLGVESIRILESHGDRATIGSLGSDKPVGEVYYTIQDGWHLKKENERMEHKPGKGWLIWEQKSQ